ncbi:indole-3-glycerol phosphate synthase TrpC [Fructobacillus evanidus]|uniref:indole-3-glycerol phosphate synthase TrpC n=1 Tax=Fructobacillus evanidus TaxID=3064281 RepID=UPI002D8BB3AB|nr:Indole-3-glycerol phosphate synthase (TrpC) [Fructobacillus sp. LMG 32999]CAK1239492.1 Indole-3-glycerol phosphate synthase (TrpC) [Fructobacillus sp. LMG 32999]CAK1240505.1 Indole-3-glycerol phosphate synthase (TrpC) [Fructobacillus sp. LMG 32999]
MILDDLVAATKRRLVKEKEAVPVADLKAQAEALPVADPQDVYDRFLAPGIHVIAEVKKASPSKGLIATDFPYQEIAQTYDQAGATAISVLTEPDYFLGKLDYLAEIAPAMTSPVLRKDFVIDPYMIYQAKVAGASIILLIVAILSPEDLQAYLNLAESLGLAVLVEAHDEDEISQALAVGAKMIGVNNRNLKDFTVSFDNSQRLFDLVPDSVAFIAESGVKKPSDFVHLQSLGINGVLIGEALMKAADPKAFIEAGLGERAHDQD